MGFCYKKRMQTEKEGRGKVERAELGKHFLFHWKKNSSQNIGSHSRLYTEMLQEHQSQAIVLQPQWDARDGSTKDLL